MRTRQEIETAFAERTALRSKDSFFLVGIGGAGMSGIARMLRHRGYAVKGTDSTPSPVIDALRAEGIEVWIGHSGDFVTPGDAVVLTDAIDLQTSPEVSAARSLGCDLFRRSQALGWLLEGKKTIAVTGTHGKTTTTGMIGAGLRAAGLDPTIVVGAEVPEFCGAIVEGSGEWAVVEACEAYDSLRDFDPYIAVLTNLELDHVDFHGDWEGLKGSVLSFVDRLPEEGLLIFNGQDKNCLELLQDGSAECAEEPFFGFTFERQFDFKLVKRLPKLSLAGKHNKMNAGAAILACRAAGADLGKSADGIASFGGAERRLQVLLEGDITIIDDYAHHPTEILASLQAIRERWFKPGTAGILPAPVAGEAPPGRLIVVYQPHLYSRTAPLIKEFAGALSLADIVVLTDIYPAREDPIPGVSSFRIVELVTKPCVYVPQRHLLAQKVAAMVQSGDVIVGMGAGNISEFGPAFVAETRRPPLPSQGERVGGEGQCKVAVLYGGDSAEREVSILSGREVVGALRAKGYDAFPIDVSESLLSGGDLARLVGVKRPDVCFLAVHGTNAEDGAIQGLLELLHLPYTGSGVLASALAMDKDRAKQILESVGLPVPAGTLLKRGAAFSPPPAPSSSVRSKPSEPDKEGASGWVVKPNAQGSTVGLSFVERREDLDKAVEKAFQFGDEVLVEEWLRGVEVSVPVLGDKALPVVEIVPESGAYDFESKYTPGATNEICPARITDDQAKGAQEHALVAHRALGCSGCTRTDMIVLADRVVCLEVNTLPGMTSTSLVPNSARAAGISFDDLCDWMVKDALARATKA